jgi:protein TonB
MMNGRPMAWQGRVVQTGGEVTSRDSTTGVPRAFAPVVQNEVVQPKSFRYRVDGATASASVLTRVSDNVAHLLPTDIFIPVPPRIDSGGALSSEQERALARLANATSNNPVTPTLPKARLIVADIYPGETVEFLFSTLTPEGRAAIQKMCQFDQATAQQTKAVTINPTSMRAPIRLDAKSAPERIKSVPPIYPAMAVAARVQGAVVVDATIGPDGKVQDAKVLRSIPLLDQAALDAVRQWEYAPTVVDGMPVPVIMTITVNFTLQ